MKKIINKKVYNTETATKVASWDNGVYGNDFRNCNEDLYRTAKGAWFIHGTGGPMSKYAVSHGNSTSGSSDIIDLTEEEAYQWMEEHDAIEGIEKYFANHIEEA